MSSLQLLSQLAPDQFETIAVFSKLATSSRKLAELKGVVETIPNQAISLNTLSLQEAKDSSAIENIFTTQTVNSCPKPPPRDASKS
ncbi:MAG: hypothetical protein H7Y22_15630 [Gemmatimonadaceae bacterium]|nr:hypothetical protein [Gloeobacterales cyanobacterium ES-bin-141]